MRVEEALPEDEAELRHFFESFEVPGRFPLRCHRTDFFKPYSLLADRHVTYCLRDGDELLGLATILYFPAIVLGVRQTVGWAMDLRVSSSRKAILGWHQEFQPLLKRERERLDCKHFFTAVPMDSDTAMTAFVRPKSPKRNLPRYYPFGRVRLHTVHGRWPWARPGLTSVHIRRGVEPAELAEYLAEKKRFQSFNIPELFARMRQWPGISAESFVGAFDGSNRLIGGCVVWDPSCVRTLSLSQPSDAVYSFHQTMAFLSWLNIARPPFKPQSPLVTRYLLDLRADNDDILHSLVTHLYDEIDPLSTMTFLSTEGTWTGLAPQGFIYTEMDYGLYCLTLPDQAVPEFIKPNMARAPTDFGLAHLL